MNAIAGKTIVIGVTGGIAGYKILDLIPLLKKQGATVHVVFTHGASTLFDKERFAKVSGNSVEEDVFEKDISYEAYTAKKRKILHIELADSADLILIAPATANILAKLAQGITDDLLSTIILATHALVLLSPSMNVKMLSHPATQKNLGLLQSFGYEIIPPDYGDLVCGYRGEGRLPTVERLYQTILRTLKKTKTLAGKKVMVTGGATIEEIDPVRILTNKSSGKMGKALAEEAYRRGATVTFFHGKNAVTSRYLFEHITFTTGEDLAKKMKRAVKNADIVIHTAAVGDFRTQKYLKKLDSKKSLALKLSPTPKILDAIKKWNSQVSLVGFKAEYNLEKQELIKKAKETLEKSHADYIVANDVGKTGVGFDTDTNEVHIVDKKGNVIEVPLAKKSIVAEKIWDYILRA